MLSRRTFAGSAIAAIAAGLAAPAFANPHAKGSFRVTKSATHWKRQLGPERFRILRKAGTERPYSSPLNNEKRFGTYVCAGCENPLFSSLTKYDSRTGWPSFYRELAGAVGYARDTSLFMVRTEEHCARCGGHLGHVFDDGPQPTGKRHCINGLSLAFKPA
ncbi:peptide-methionine (R)-S-oxide reductase MsrB [Sphingomicrobium marinum]|uniref:peptide-methionine (R)-S-oxide reductase MsrB n=1 Tax=Sphingomicrobium marinum TaxID=1227950 RepID=UPI00223EDA5A|nr:peptide-methionine (R)-S-oxide reductase MsrB [Sphingomicrobium marinum]